MEVVCRIWREWQPSTLLRGVRKKMEEADEATKHIIVGSGEKMERAAAEHIFEEGLG